MKIINRHIILILVLLVCNSPSSGQLVLSPGSSITIKDGTSLYVGTNLYLKSDASGSGHLADQNATGNCTILGDKTVERYLTNTGWHNVSSPVNNANSSIFTGTDLIFYYDETIILNDWNFGWVWYDGSLIVMKGYDIFLPSTITTYYAATNVETLNTGSYAISITRTNVANGEAENKKGWNLIGNPYPSPVDWLMESGWDKSDINDAKYIWDPDNNNYTIFIGGSSPTGINGGTQYIPSNQGFWVQAIQNGIMIINNSARLGIMTATPDYYKDLNSTTQELRLIASGNGFTDETMIRFMEGTTSGVDINNDATKLFSTNDSVPQLYTMAKNTSMAINSHSEIVDGLAIDMNFLCKTAGQYSISIDESSTIDKVQNIYLKDLKEEKMICLSSDMVYSFYHHPSYISSRFVVYFNPSEEIIKNLGPQSYFNVVTYKNTLTITRNTSKHYNGEVRIYSILGQRLKSYPLSDDIKTIINVSLTEGYYIASIVADNLVLNSKIRITH